MSRIMMIGVLAGGLGGFGLLTPQNAEAQRRGWDRDDWEDWREDQEDRWEDRRWRESRRRPAYRYGYGRYYRDFDDWSARRYQPQRQYRGYRGWDDGQRYYYGRPGYDGYRYRDWDRRNSVRLGPLQFDW